MCGIFGSLNVSVADKASSIFKALHHRGPDETGFFKKDNVELFHTRLAIQDLHKTGRQPMHYQGLSVVFNGEIYNHLELREKYGLFAPSNSDTLTLLMLFQLKGIQVLDELDGMFAFALYNEHSRELFLARDRAGKKPLYVYQNASRFAFSSELNILSSVFNPEKDFSALSAYLYLGYHYRKSTPYLGVTELENGSYLKINTVTGVQSLCRWFDIRSEYSKKKNMPYQDAIRFLDSKLQLAVKRRIDSSDLDVGCFLSGGIDSGLVTAIAAKHKPMLKTFTVRMSGRY